jgi:prevent-host-death family protein
VTRISITEAREQLPEIINQARYQNVVTILTRHGKDMAAIAPIGALKEDPDAGAKKVAISTTQLSKKSAPARRQG